MLKVHISDTDSKNKVCFMFLDDVIFNPENLKTHSAGLQNLIKLAVSNGKIVTIEKMKI